MGMAQVKEYSRSGRSHKSRQTPAREMEPSPAGSFPNSWHFPRTPHSLFGRDPAGQTRTPGENFRAYRITTGFPDNSVSVHVDGLSCTLIVNACDRQAPPRERSYCAQVFLLLDELLMTGMRCSPVKRYFFDDMRNFLVLAQILSERGMEVVKAEDGKKPSWHWRKIPGSIPFYRILLCR